MIWKVKILLMILFLGFTVYHPAFGIENFLVLRTGQSYVLDFSFKVHRVVGGDPSAMELNLFEKEKIDNQSQGYQLLISPIAVKRTNIIVWTDQGLYVFDVDISDLREQYSETVITIPKEKLKFEIPLKTNVFVQPKENDPPLLGAAEQSQNKAKPHPDGLTINNDNASKESRLTPISINVSNQEMQEKPQKKDGISVKNLLLKLKPGKETDYSQDDHGKVQSDYPTPKTPVPSNSMTHQDQVSQNKENEETDKNYRKVYQIKDLDTPPDVDLSHLSNLKILDAYTPQSTSEFKENASLNITIVENKTEGKNQILKIEIKNIGTKDELLNLGYTQIVDNLDNLYALENNSIEVITIGPQSSKVLNLKVTPPAGTDPRYLGEELTLTFFDDKTQEALNITVKRFKGNKDV